MVFVGLERVEVLVRGVEFGVGGWVKYIGSFFFSI